MNLVAIDTPVSERLDVSARPAPTRATKGAHAAADASGEPMAAMDITIVSERRDFDGLEAEWTKLYERAGHAGNPFQSFGWCWHWANHFLGGTSKTELCILTGRIDGQLTMVWPLVKDRAAGLTKLTWLGAPVTQYGDVLLDKASGLPELKAAWDYLSKSAPVDLIELYKVREDAAIAPLLAHINPVLTHNDKAPFVDLSQDPTFEDYARKRYSKRRRSYFRRYRRRFEEIGPVRMEVHAEGDRANELARQLLDMKEEWLIEKSMVSRALDDPRTRKFFEASTKDPQKPTGTCVAALFCGDELIAANLNYTAKKRTIAHVITYKMAYERWSPGQLLTVMHLEHARQNGEETFDFMGPWAQFKMDWADRTVELNDWAVPMTIKGSLWAKVYLGFARDRMKKLFLKLPSSIKKLSARRIASMIVTG